jgi:hypothetical protein
MSDKNVIFYQEFCSKTRQHESLLFQRFNYFLITIAFLVTAFIQLVINTSNRTFPLALLVGTTGILLSWIFTAINFHNSKIIKMLYIHAKIMEDAFFSDKQLNISDLPDNYLLSQIFDSGYFKADLLFIFYGCIKETQNFSFNLKLDDKNKPESGNVPGPHTWMIPYLFIIFWLIAIILYISFFLTPFWWFILPLAVLIYVIHPFLYRYIIKKLISLFPKTHSKAEITTKDNTSQN